MGKIRPGMIVWIIGLFFLLASGKARGGGYLSSAHGNSGYGVKRQAIPASTGNCLHCHEMHASLNGTEPPPQDNGPHPFSLFSPGYVSQTDIFCLKCHDGTTAISSRVINNYFYAYRAGGDTNLGLVNNIKDMVTINLVAGSHTIVSAHDMGKVLNFICDSTRGWGFSCDTPPCVGCHNPHYVQRDEKTASSRGWLVSRPSTHGTSNYLWGDESGEKMRDFAGALTYQAPYRYGSNSTYEPDGSLTYDGSNLTDFPDFCLDCHGQKAITNYGVRKIDWSSTGDKHGLASADNGTLLRPPYDPDNPTGKYVLSCLDCHEPHGSFNLMLIRSEVNGEELEGDITDNASKQWGYLCRRCHKDDYLAQKGTNATNGWEFVHHLDPNDAPYPGPPRPCSCHGGSPWSNPIPCSKCHYHGAIDSITGRKNF